MDVSMKSENSYENRVFLHNLSYDVTQEDLINFFIEQGICPNPNVTVMTNPRNKKPAGCAIVQFASAEEVEKAQGYSREDKK